MNVANHLATADLTSSAVGTAIRANAKIHLTGDYPPTRRSTRQAIPLQPIFAIYAPDQAPDLSGQTEVHATPARAAQEHKQLEAHLTIPTLKLAYSNTVQLSRDFAYQGRLQRQRGNAAAFRAEGNRY